MQQLTNPYTPNAGAEPKAIVGRNDELESFEVLLHRLRDGMAEQSMIITGLRGVGKTVLLGRFRDKALREDCVVVEWEVSKHSTDEFRLEIASRIRTALLETSPKARWGDRARNAASVLRSFSLAVDPLGSLTAGFGIDAKEGYGDHSQLGLDLTDLLVAVGEAAREHGRVIVILVDEIQFLARDQMEALIEALHKTVQRSLPVTLVGAGLPQVGALANDAKTYAERLFKFVPIGNLSADDAALALALPAADRGITWTVDALDLAFQVTGGYPYFIQEVGYAVWPVAEGPVIGADDVREALPGYQAKLDQSFFRVRLERTTPLLAAYLRAMAELGPGAQKAQDVAALMGRTSNQLGPVRAKLIDMGLLYTPEHGLAAFTVPQFDQYLRRVMPRLDAPMLSSGR
ncbi:MAG: ATP-binding protein [Propionibacteriaceae bacterium]|nr:ATP-binding protein [Propionibacteriaceae bacterium]